MKYLYGFHDPGGEHLFGDRPGWIVHTVALKDESPQDYRIWERKGCTNIVRLNWGYGDTGTIPLPDSYQKFSDLCASYVGMAPGCTRWIIGNEPNHANEWPAGKKITPRSYAMCYNQCREAIKAVQPNSEVLVAAVAPWNEKDSGPWIPYFQEMLRSIPETDGFAIHAYTHGATPDLVHSDAKMHPPYQGYHWHFRVYRDWLLEIPPKLNHLPVYITEANQGDEPWADINSGYIRELYKEINDWNHRLSESKIHCVCLYRWPNYDRWAIEGKNSLLEDFKQAVDMGLQSPSSEAILPGVVSPSVPPLPAVVESGEGAAAPSQIRQWDPRLTARDVDIITPNEDIYWEVYEGKWYDEQEADHLGPDHHIMLDAVDANGQRIVGLPFLVSWPGGSTVVYTEAKPGEEFGGNFPMTPGEFYIHVDDGTPSESVNGIEMGSLTPDGWNAGIHTSTSLKWRKRMEKSTTVYVPTVAVAVPKDLVHPVSSPTLRTISQGFGKRPDYYRQFKVDGVPLRGHNGIDFATPVGTMVMVVDDGIAIEVWEDAGWGKYIKVKHAWGESLYAHLSLINVVQGENLLRGRVIGLSGNTGNSSGPHLHFGMRINPYSRRDGWGGYSDPAEYLTRSEASFPPTPPPASTTSPISPAPTAPIIPPLGGTVDSILGDIREAARISGVPWTLLANIAWAESSFRINITSPSGAMGLMGLMPPTWEEWRHKVAGASDPFNPLQNLTVGAVYFAWLMQHLDGSRYDALIAYNWGIGNLQARRVEPPLATKIYAAKIIHGHELMRALEVG